jgi:ubiquinone/menaquinone biosynthesis C-methylase UbiE
MRLRWAGRGMSRKLMRLKMSLDRDPLAATAEKFGEAYFMDPASGSAYHVNNYLETALLSRTYFEMAEIMARCFKPKRVLEVGCAAGPTVYHLNTYFDTEAHGVDVSAWAVQNRLHPNISQATAGKLPFPDGHFDVVFSCHMLEHLTTETVDQSIREMTRICTDDGIQFHLLPILGSGPYGDIFGSIVGLRKDQTHNLLHPREWWIERWKASAWQDSGLRIGHVYDNHGFEFSDCQFVLSRAPIKAEICRNVAQKNLDVARAYQNALVRRPLPGLEVFLNDIRDNWK